MSPNEHALWTKINNFPLDDLSASFSFSDRLARENGWTKEYTLRVVEEYKKFLFLCCITPSGVTPSDPVDQAWHLHLTYTRSYWTDLCKNTLEKEIHHHPTKGGKQEGQKFNGFYTTSHALYQEKFGTPPPPDIWHNNQTRFSDIHFQRVNRRRYWVIRKPGRPAIRSLTVGGVLIFALPSVQAMLDTPNLLFIGFLVVMGIVVYKNRNKTGGGSGCSVSSCSSDSGDGSHHGDSGCSSGCSGCSSSGCSGCGGGD